MKMSICTIRLDDITPDMNWEKFSIIKEIFDKYNIKPLIGVVPDNQDASLQAGQVKENFWSYLQELQQEGWSIAQHGYQHRYETKDPGLLGINPFSEFAGLSYERQYHKIKKGKDILQSKGIYATIFMAPGHTYDVNTLKALKANGFTYVTDGYSNFPYEYQGLYFIPCTLSEPRIVKGYNTLCLHINHMEKKDFDELDKFFQRQIGIIKNFSQLLEKNIFKKRTLALAIQEKKNLALKKFKIFIGTNPTMQDYMAKTNSSNTNKKKLRRIMGLPMLAVKLLLSGVFKWKL